MVSSKPLPLIFSQQMEDTLAHALIDQYPTVTPMGITAENLATKYGLSRQDCDEYALSSQARWAAGMFLVK
jgi:acetyl-CoA acyltransferase 2